MKIGIHAQSHHRIPTGELFQLINWISERGHTILITGPFSKHLERSGKLKGKFLSFQQGEIVEGLDIILSLGGDGTILDSILYSVPNDCPILGINFGRLGFLATSPSKDYQSAILKVETGDFQIQSRGLLEIVIESNNGEEKEENGFALNEITITRRDSASMITVKTSIDGHFLNDYWGDGLIVSTATGSTGYSLSCGGPILWPSVPGMVVAPISPHNLSMRPLVLPETAVLDLTPLGRQQKAMLSLDSRSVPFVMGKKIRIFSSPRKAKFVELGDNDFSQTLREKLFWGKDIRN